jgi:hypothetical protein
LHIFSNKGIIIGYPIAFNIKNLEDDNISKLYYKIIEYTKKVSTGSIITCATELDYINNSFIIDYIEDMKSESFFSKFYVRILGYLFYERFQRKFTIFGKELNININNFVLLIVLLCIFILFNLFEVIFNISSFIFILILFILLLIIN